MTRVKDSESGQGSSQDCASVATEGAVRNGRRCITMPIGNAEYAWSLPEARRIHERLGLLIQCAEAFPCTITEYDGSFHCTTHGRSWGAITNPDKPCPSDTVLIWSMEHDAWWAPAERGYTAERKKAGLYDRQRAQRIVDGSLGQNERIEELTPDERSTLVTLGTAS